MRGSRTAGHTVASGTVLTLAGLLPPKNKLFLRKEAKQNGLEK